jgi:hypothetical protein
MWYLKSAFDTYQKLQDTVQNRLSEVQSAVLSPVDMMKRFLGAATPGTPGSQQPNEVDSLRKRIAELEAQLRKPAQRKRSTRKKRR